MYCQKIVNKNVIKRRFFLLIILLKGTKWKGSWKFHRSNSRSYLSLSRFKCQVKDMHYGLHIAISVGPHVLHLLTFTGPISYIIPGYTNKGIYFDYLSFHYYFLFIILSTTHPTPLNNTTNIFSFSIFYFITNLSSFILYTK